MKHTIRFISSFLFLNLGFAQTGPGGVGATDGTSSLVLWLDANTVSGINGATISSWVDQSGYGYDFTGGNGAILTSPSVNGYPALSFNGTSHYFERAFTAGITPANFTIFSATKVLTNSNYKTVISNRENPAGSATAGFMLYSIPSSNNWQFWTGTSSGAWQQTTGNTSTAGSWAGQMLEYRNTTNGKKLFLNGTVNATNSHSMTSNASRPCRVGAGRNEGTPDYYFRGDIGEVIMFDEVLNSAQEIIINNYLAAKYNYTLSSNDVYSQDNAGAGNYDHDVAGIGRVSATNLHDDAQGTGIVRILNPTGLGNNEFLMWGHNNGVQQADEIVDVPSPVVARFDRTWRVSEVNSAGTAVDVGAIDIRFDLTGLGSVSASDLRLLVDTDNDGVFIDEVPISGATSIGGNVYQFSGVTAIANNLRFTLGTINSFQTPLPIELFSFEVINLDGKSVKLNWQTASEINNDFFTIERSINGSNWEGIITLDGAGNSSSSLSYSTIDANPFLGISYYRLKQTDFDGQFSYSQIRSIQIDNLDESKIELFPNPTENLLTIVGSPMELNLIKVYNAIGQDVTNLTLKIYSSESKLILDLSDLSKGMYYLKTRTTENKVYKQ